MNPQKLGKHLLLCWKEICGVQVSFVMMIELDFVSVLTLVFFLPPQQVAVKNGMLFLGMDTILFWSHGTKRTTHTNISLRF